MPNNADAVFSEVLEIAVDVDAFTTGLAQLESAYEAFVDRLSEKGLGTNSVLQVGAFTALEQQLGQLSQVMQQFGTAVAGEFTGVDSQLKSIQASVESTAQSAIDAKAKIAAEEITAQAGGSGGGGGAVPNVSSIIGGASNFFGGIGNAIATMNGGLLGMLGNMAALRVAWAAVGSAINVVIDIIKSPFEIIKAGFAY